MENMIDTLQHKIGRFVTGMVGRNASRATRRKARLFIGVAGIIVANVWLGAVIGHGIAALLGAGFFFVVGLYEGEAK